MGGKDKSKLLTGTDWWNVYLMSTFAALDSFQFGLFTWSFFPFIQQLNPSLPSSSVGLLMACMGVGEAMAAPLFGVSANRLGLVLPPIYASLCVSVAGNFVYLCLNALAVPWRFPVMLLSRVLTGAGSGNRAVYFAYISAVSGTADRAKAMAICSGISQIGLMLAPAAQMAFNWIGPQGWELWFIRVSMYTAPSILALIINVISYMLLRFCVTDGLDRLHRQETDVISLVKDDGSKVSIASKGSTRGIPVDVIAVSVCIATRAVRILVTSNVESIGSHFSQVMFGVSEEEALANNSQMQLGIGLITIAVGLLYVFTDYTKWISDRINCFGSLLAFLAFHLLTFSWPFLPGYLDCTANATSATIPRWCETLAPINKYVYYVSFALIFGVAYTCLNNSLQTLYSLVLGQGRQGTMQGVNQAIGCVSRIFGPVGMSYLFTDFGPRMTWSIEIGMLLLCIAVWILVWKRLVPSAVRASRIYAAGMIDPIQSPKEMATV